MEYYESVKTRVEIRRTMLSCNNTQLASFMQKLTELLIKSNQKHIIYKFIVNLSLTQNNNILQKIEQILPNCKIQDSITKSMDIITKKSIKHKTKLTNKKGKTNKSNKNNHRSKQYRNSRKKKKHSTAQSVPRITPLINISKTQTHSFRKTKLNSNHSIELENDNRITQNKSEIHCNKYKKYNPSNCNILNSISTDVLLSVFNYLSIHDLISLQQTCRYFSRECKHPNALYMIHYSFDNENNNSLIYNQIRYANIKKLSLSHEFGEFDFEITHKQFNNLWLKNVNELCCLFTTEYIDSCNFNQFLELNEFKFEAINKLSINLAGQDGSNWLNLILNKVINAHVLQELYLTHILESSDVLKSILDCRNLKVLSIKNLDFPTMKYYDSQEYYEFFERENIILPHIQQIIYIDDESCVGVHEYLQFIGYLIKNSQKNKIDLTISYRFDYTINNNYVLNLLFGDKLNAANIIKKINRLSFNIDDGMINSIVFLADKLLEYNHQLDSLKICGMIIKNNLDLHLLYDKFTILFNRSNTTNVLFTDYYHNDDLRMSVTNPSFLCWVQRLLQISPSKVLIDFRSHI